MYSIPVVKFYIFSFNALKIVITSITIWGTKIDAEDGFGVGPGPVRAANIFSASSSILAFSFTAFALIFINVSFMSPNFCWFSFSASSITCSSWNYVKNGYKVNTWLMCKLLLIFLNNSLSHNILKNCMCSLAKK